MAATTTPSRPTWLVLTLFAALLLVVGLAVTQFAGWMDERQQDRQTDRFIEQLCASDPDC